MTNPNTGDSEQTRRIQERLSDGNFYGLSFDELDDLFEDRDPAEFL